MILRIALVLSLVAGLAAETISCAGVLGNSGEQGSSLVRFGHNLGDYGGIGVAVDRYGTLWDRAGEKRLNRYAADGRLIASHPLPVDQSGWHQNSVITVVRDLVVIRVGTHVLTLAVDAPAGSEATRLALDPGVQAMSPGSFDGRLAIIRGEQIEWLDPVSGTTVPIIDHPHQVNRLEVGADGTVYIGWDWHFQRVVDGRLDPDWRKAWPGESPELHGDYWYGHAWHGTVRRYDAKLDPAPGVILGGASGSFIGYLPQNSELLNGRGMADLGSGVLALSGLAGVLHLATWNGAEQRLSLARRIGALAGPAAGLAIDGQGRIWCGVGVWLWDDAPDTPIRWSINAPDEMAQATLIDDARMVVSGYTWGRSRIYFGSLDRELHDREVPGLPKGGVATAVVGEGGGRQLITAFADGSAFQAAINHDGQPSGEFTPLELSFTQPLTALASLSRGPDGSLLVAADGALIRLVAAGDGWKEQRRLDAVGDERFGARIHHAWDGERLWISDATRHRVLVTDDRCERVVASFGSADRSGDSLETLDAPERIAVHGRRAVVLDAGNQRLVKLTLEP